MTSAPRPDGLCGQDQTLAHEILALDNDCPGDGVSNALIRCLTAELAAEIAEEPRLTTECE